MQGLSRTQSVAGTSVSCLVLALAMSAGCASGPKPDADVAKAAARIEQAQQAGAAEAAALELKSANDNLQKARNAAEEGEDREAINLARRAEADAEVAEAKARHQQAQKAVAEVKSSTETLRQEAERAQQAAPAPVVSPSTGGQPVVPGDGRSTDPMRSGSME